MIVDTDAALAPEFPSGSGWLNVERPLRLQDLRGKVVLLYFWTYSCIHCLHVLPELAWLQEKHARELVVVGVHSGKFTSTQETENVRQTVRRYGLTHPILNDREMILWRLYRIQTWPTVVLLDPEGREVGRLTGERVFRLLDDAIAELVTTYGARRMLDRTPWVNQAEPVEAPASLLSFPAKMVVEPGSARGFIADSNHHRIVIVSLPDARVLEIVGSGQAGLVDGHFAMAQFRRPQGLAFAGGLLYVADTENHALRLVDLERRTVRTLAGTGEQAQEPEEGGVARDVPLNSPWDLVVQGQEVYVTLAGAHQVWRLHLERGELRPFAGTGRKARVDGPHARAAFAQPSGLTTDGDRLYVVDAETSSLRAVDLDPEGNVTTLAGGDLFAFGDRDGPGLLARLQHPLGIAYAEGVLYLADSYNHKIKTYTLATGLSETLLEDPALLREPRGLCLVQNRLYIADANDHALRRLDLPTRRVESLHLHAAPEASSTSLRPEFRGPTYTLPLQTIGPGTVTLTACVSAPPGYRLRSEAPHEVRVRVLGDIASDVSADQPRLLPPGFPAQLPVVVQPGQGSLEIEYAVYSCQEENETVCLLKQARLVLPVRVEMSFPGHALQVSFDTATD